MVLADDADQMEKYSLQYGVNYHDDSDDGNPDDGSPATDVDDY